MLARAIREQAEHSARTRRRTLTLVLAAAALIAAVVGIRALTQTVNPPSAVAARLSGDVVLAHAGIESTLTAARDQAASVGDTFSTLPHKNAKLTLPSGASVNIEGSSRVSLDDATPARTRVRVDVGEVRVRVPRLPEGSRFEVITPDTLVTVHGTEFSVHVDPTGVTSVHVYEGRVNAKARGKSAMLTPGADAAWSSVAAALPTAPQSSVPAQPSTAQPAPVWPTASGVSPKVARTAPPLADTSHSSQAPQSAKTSLAEQNRVFAAALSARDRGNDSRAVALLDELLHRYPSSPLAPEARLERFRALKRLGKDQQAASEARRYLREAPSSAARDEARDVAMPKK